MTRQVEKLHLERSFEKHSDDESLKRKRKLGRPSRMEEHAGTEDYDSDDFIIPQKQTDDDENLHYFRKRFNNYNTENIYLDKYALEPVVKYNPV